MSQLQLDSLFSICIWAFSTLQVITELFIPML